MKPLLFFILLFSSTTINAQNTSGDELSNYKFIELGHGLAPDYIPSADTIPWNKRPIYKFKIIKTTDSIPAKLHTVFGIEFKITGKQTPDLAYTVEWVYPKPIKEPDGRLYGAVKTGNSMSTNKETNASFYLNETYELVKGNWKLNVYIEKKLVYSHVFILY